MPSTESVLAEKDVRALVRLLGDVAGSRRDVNGMKRMLMDGLSVLIRADSWLWCLGCEMEPGQQPAYLSMSHGGFDEARYAHMLSAASHPGMAEISISLLTEMRRKQSHVTRLREQVASDQQFFASGIYPHMEAADIGSFILSLRPLDERSVSVIGIYRRREAPAFSERESRMAHIILTEVSWLHELGWPEDRGASVPRLSPRLRLVLNLLLDGRSRKAIAAHLSLSENTVAGYQKALYSLFGVSSQAALMRRFQLGDGGDR